MSCHVKFLANFFSSELGGGGEGALCRWSSAAFYFEKICHQYPLNQCNALVNFTHSIHTNSPKLKSYELLTFLEVGPLKHLPVAGQVPQRDYVFTPIMYTEIGDRERKKTLERGTTSRMNLFGTSFGQE